jgi:hypothetical protein
MKPKEQAKFIYELFDRHKMHTRMCIIKIQHELGKVNSQRLAYWQEVEKELEKL